MSTLCFIFFYFSTRELVVFFSTMFILVGVSELDMFVGVTVSIGSRAPSVSGTFHYAWLMMSTLCLIFYFFTRELVWSFFVRCSHSLGDRTWHVCRCHQEAYIYVLHLFGAFNNAWLMLSTLLYLVYCFLIKWETWSIDSPRSLSLGVQSFRCHCIIKIVDLWRCEFGSNMRAQCM